MWETYTQIQEKSFYITHASLINKDNSIASKNLNQRSAHSHNIIYHNTITTYNIGFPLNFVMPLGDAGRLRMIMNVMEYVNKYSSIKCSILQLQNILF